MKKILAITLITGLLGACSDQKQAEQSTDRLDTIPQVEYVKSTPEWSKNSTIYEVNLRQYSEEGTIAAFRKHLPRLQKLGVDILWFMPIHPIGVKNRKGSMGSYYSVKDYKAIAPQYGTMDEWKSLVDTIHEMGMHVVIDWVANHSAFDNVWIEEGHKEYYTLDSVGELQPPLGTDWWDVADLNYENEGLRVAMIDALKFWVRETDIDGYRCDVADWVPTDFWNEARQALDSVKPVFMLAEADNPELHEKAFDMTYGWGFHFTMNEIAQGKKEVSEINKYIDSNKYQPEDYRVHFITNHDENTWKGTINERFGKSQEAFAALSFLLEGMPLIYSGQEAGLNKRLEFFEKDVINWEGKDLSEFYTRLIKLKKDNPALWNGEHGGQANMLETDQKGAVAFVREKGDNKVFVALNLIERRRAFKVSGIEASDQYVHWLSENGEKVDSLNFDFAFEPWGFTIYTMNSNPDTNE